MEVNGLIFKPPSTKPLPYTSKITIFTHSFVVLPSPSQPISGMRYTFKTTFHHYNPELPDIATVLLSPPRSSTQITPKVSHFSLQQVNPKTCGTLGTYQFSSHYYQRTHLKDPISDPRKIQYPLHRPYRVSKSLFQTPLQHTF